MKHNDPEHLTGHLSIEAAAGKTLSDTRVRLLEAIDQLGSINKAAKIVPLSYKAAWDAIDNMNNLSPQPLVERVTGGRQGGGTSLTDYGRQMIAMFRALEMETQEALERLNIRLPAGKDPLSIADFRKMLRRMSMKSSARNQFAGPITGLHNGEVDFEVRMRLHAGQELVAVITQASAENLDLHIGDDIFAHVKSSSVLITTDPLLRLGATNQLWGEVLAIHKGSINDEITLALPSGKNVTAVITHHSRERLMLKPGDKAAAIFKPSSVTLAICG